MSENDKIKLVMCYILLCYICIYVLLMLIYAAILCVCFFCLYFVRKWQNKAVQSYISFKIWPTLRPESWVRETLLAQLNIPNYVPAKYCVCGTIPTLNLHFQLISHPIWSLVRFTVISHTPMRSRYRLTLPYIVHGPRPKFSHIGSIWVGKTW